MRKGHIAFYIGSLQKGGAERVFVNLAEYFWQQGYQVTMVTQYQREDEYILPSEIKRILSDLTIEEEKGRIYNFYARIRKLRRIFTQINPDLVMTCIGKNNFMAIVSNLWRKTKVVVSVVGEPTEEYPNLGMRLLAKTLFLAADGIVVQTKQCRAFFPKYLQNKCKILKNSLNPLFLRESFEGERKRSIVSVGRMDENKNQAMLLKAFAELTDRFPEVSLSLYGDGSTRNKLEQLAKELQIEERVLFGGVITNVLERIYEEGIFVLTSKTEGMPNALIEAMALGLPVVSTDCPCGGPSDLIQSGENGILVPVNDVKALRDALCYLLENPKRAKEMGICASAIQDSCNPTVTNQAWQDYFEGIINVI